MKCNNCHRPTAHLYGVTGDLGACCYVGPSTVNMDALGAKS